MTKTKSISHLTCPKVKILFGFFSSTQNPNKTVSRLNTSIHRKVDKIVRQILSEYFDHEVTRREVMMLKNNKINIFFDRTSRVTKETSNRMDDIGSWMEERNDP